MRRLPGFHLHGLMSFLQGALQQLFYEQRALHHPLDHLLRHHYLPQLQVLSSIQTTIWKTELLHARRIIDAMKRCGNSSLLLENWNRYAS